MSGFANDGGIGSSVAGFADPLNIYGLKKGPGAPDNQNAALGQLNAQNELYSSPNLVNDLNSYATGNKSSNDVLSGRVGSAGMSPQLQVELGNSLATGATTGSKFATEQVENNPLLSGLYGKGGTMQSMENDLNNQVGQGWSLQPQDQTMYGQAAGNIARQYGQQGNQVASNLASRGLSSSGAAGAAFSGLAGNQNEMLAQAQQQIMQQRFQNTMSQANAINQMGQGAASAINQQYGRQLSGAQNQKQGLESAGGLTQGANSQNLANAEFQQQNKPATIGDMVQGAVGQGMGSAGKAGGQAAAAGLFA